MRKPANARRAHEVPRVSIGFDPERGRTHQSFKDECDATRIVETYARTGMVTHQNPLSAQYGDAPSQTLFEAACVQAEIRSSAEERALNPPESSGTEATSEDQEETKGTPEGTPESGDTEPQEPAKEESSG